MIFPAPLLSTIAETRSMRLIKVLMLLTASAELPTYKEKAK
jgi:hypothetical protein